MKWAQRIFFFIVAAGILMAPQTSQINTYVDGNVLTASQLNAEFGNLYSTINALDEDNFLSTTSFPATFVNAAVAGDGLGRDAGTGVMEVNVDDSSIGITADTLLVKTSGITSAMILNDTIVAGDIATGGVATAEILDGTIIAGDIATGAVTSTGILDNTIASADILDGTVASADILNATVATADMAGSLSLGLDGGTVSAPSLFFTGDTNTGIYSSGADTIVATTGGAIAGTYSSQGVGVGPNGSAGAPSLTFSNDADTGLYRSAANTLTAAAGGAAIASFTSSGMATAVGKGIDAGGGGNFIRWVYFTGTLGASAGTTLTVPGVVFLGAVGRSTSAGSGAIWRQMQSESVMDSLSIGFDDTASDNDDEITIDNNWSGGTNTYYVLAYYL